MRKYAQRQDTPILIAFKLISYLRFAFIKVATRSVWYLIPFLSSDLGCYHCQKSFSYRYIYNLTEALYYPFPC